MNKKYVFLFFILFVWFELGIAGSQESSETLLDGFGKHFNDNYTNKNKKKQEQKVLVPQNNTENWDDIIKNLNSFAERFLPFSFDEENQAIRGNKNAIKKVRKSLHSLVDQYSEEIHQASIEFDVPESIIAAVIIIESSGKTDAKNPDSSATGLMQIINSTFAQMKKELKNQFNIIVKDRLNPRDNILAGTYYLSKMFKIANKKQSYQLDKHNVEHWEQALRYYFAGPGYQDLPTEYDTVKKTIVMVYSGGTKVSIKDPLTYSSKGLKFARLIKNAQA